MSISSSYLLVHLMLKTLFSQIDTLVDATEFENQRTIYAEDQRVILNAQNRFNEMAEEMAAVDCTEEVQCLRAKTRIAEIFHEEFNIQGSVLVLGLKQKLAFSFITKV